MEVIVEKDGKKLPVNISDLKVEEQTSAPVRLDSEILNSLMRQEQAIALISLVETMQGNDRLPEEIWMNARKFMGEQKTSFDAYKAVHEMVFANWNEETHGPKPVWAPSDNDLNNSNVATLMKDKDVGAKTYDDLHSWSVEDGGARFMQKMLDRIGIHFYNPPRKIADEENGRWLTGATLNIAEQVFILNDPEAIAIKFQRKDGSIKEITYRELDELSNQVANGLDTQEWFRTGNKRVALGTPMTPEAVASWLGIVKAGGVVVPLVEGEAESKAADRLRISEASAIIIADALDGGNGKTHEMFDKIARVSNIPAVVIPNMNGNDVSVTLRDGDITWSSFLSDEKDYMPVRRDAYAMTNILFSSGTTGDPKAIVGTALTALKYAMDGFQQDMKEGDVVGATFSPGWMMGPWHMFSAMLNKATMAISENGFATKEYAGFVEEAGMTHLTVVPAMIEGLQKTKAAEGKDWSSVRAFISTGSGSSPELVHYACYLAPNAAYGEYCGGSEIGGGYALHVPVLNQAPSLFTAKALGIDFVVLDKDSFPVKLGEIGEIFITFDNIPPAGISTKLLNFDHAEKYFGDAPRGPSNENFVRVHGDMLELTSGGFTRHHGRGKDMGNPDGVLTSAAKVEDALMGRVSGVEKIKGIKDAVAIFPKPKGLGEKLVVFVELEPGIERGGEALKKEVAAAVRKGVNAQISTYDVQIAPSPIVRNKQTYNEAKKWWDTHEAKQAIQGK